MADFITPSFIIKYSTSLLKPLIDGIIMSIILYLVTRKNNMSWKQRLVLQLLPIILGIISFFFMHAPKPRSHYMLSILTEPKSIYTGFTHKKKGRWPFVGSAVIRINGENYVFIGGGRTQDDVLLKYQDNKFINIIKDTGLSSKEATFSAVSFDMDGNGLDDLIVGRHNGVFLYKQMKPFEFTKTKIYGQKDKIPAALSISDYNKDGTPDVYISYVTPVSKYRGTIFNDPTHSRKNVLLDGVKFKDVSVETKAQGIYNTFTSAFIDLNNDSFPDLVLSNDSGETEFLENVNGKYFKKHIPYVPKGNWMGLASGDIDNDGDQDVFLTNLGTDIRKDRMSLGDIKKGQQQAFQHVLLRNDGEFKFVEVSKDYGISGTGFGWGAAMADLDYDTNIDLLFGENFMANPVHWLFPGIGRFFSNKKRKFKFKNPNFAQTPLLVDLNKDNIKDVIWINMQGPTIAYINKVKQNYIGVRLPETAEFVNAEIKAKVGDKTMVRQIIQGGIGFGSDQSNMVQFGLGDLETVDSVTVKTIKGKVYKVVGPKINSVLVMKKTKLVADK